MEFNIELNEISPLKRGATSFTNRHGNEVGKDSQRAEKIPFRKTLPLTD
jgi:hypothetical protein